MIVFGFAPAIIRVKVKINSENKSNHEYAFLYIRCVDDTFVRSYGTKRIAMPHIIEHIKELYKEGATMYCWSSGGGEYAKNSAIEFGIDHCFTAFLPKPHITIDDMEFSQWHDLYQVHPNECHGNTLESYKRKIGGS